MDRASWNLENVGFTAPRDNVYIWVLGLNKCFDSLSADRKTDDRLTQCAEDFVNQLRGHNFDASYGGVSAQAKNKSLATEVREWLDKCEEADCSLILLEEKDYSKYATIKRLADLELGRYTVCAVGSKIADRAGVDEDEDKKGSRYQVLSNLALKLNMKRGGDNHWLEFDALEAMFGDHASTKTTMICGADVTHPGAGGKLGCPSIACVVGSVDDRFMNYPGSMRLQAGRQEVSAVSHCILPG